MHFADRPRGPFALSKKKRAHPGSNQGPADLQSAALPLSYTPTCGQSGIELPRLVTKKKKSVRFPDAISKAVWSRGMILRLGRRGPGFEPRNGPLLIFYRCCSPRQASGPTTKKISAAGTRTRVSWVRAKYPNQLDYGGDVFLRKKESRPTGNLILQNKETPTPRGFEPLRAEPNGFLVHLLNHSDTVSTRLSSIFCTECRHLTKIPPTPPLVA